MNLKYHVPNNPKITEIKLKKKKEDFETLVRR